MAILQSIIKEFSRVASHVRTRRASKRVDAVLYAAIVGDLRRLKRAFRKQEDLSTDTLAASAMMTAVRHNHLEAVEFFLKRKVPASATAPFFRHGQKAMDLAIENNNEDMMAMLKLYSVRQSIEFLDKLHQQKNK